MFYVSHRLRLSVTAPFYQFYSNQGLCYRFWPFGRYKTVQKAVQSNVLSEHALAVRKRVAE